MLTKESYYVGCSIVLLCALSYNLFKVRNKNPRMKRENSTVTAMIALYCRKNHGSNELCAECTSLLDYARGCLDKCPFQEGKPTCGKCPVHCFKPDIRVKIRAVMRYAGPQMIYRHPIMAIFHLIDSRRKEPLSHCNTHITR